MPAAAAPRPRLERGRLYSFELEPEVRDWLESLSDSETPCDREEEKHTGGIECIMIGEVRTAIVGMEHLPALEMGDQPLDRCAKR